MSVHQKLGINLESKVVQKLSLEKKVSTKKWSPKLMFLDIFFLIRLIFDIHFHYYQISSEYVDSWPKTLLIRTHNLWNSTTELILMYIRSTYLILEH